LADHCSYDTYNGMERVWEPNLSHQMKKGRWYNAKTKKLLKLDF
jgi:hypothetical protein